MDKIDPIPGSIEYGKVFHLRMDDFVPPDRRMDAYPSRKFDVPRSYRSDAVTIACALDSVVTMQIESHVVYMEAGDLVLLAPFTTRRAHIMQPGGGLVNVVLRTTRVREALPRLFETSNPIGDFLENCSAGNGPMFLHLHTRGLDFDRAVFPEAASFFVSNRNAGALSRLLWENRVERALLTLTSYPQIQSQAAEFAGTEARELSRVLDCMQRRLSTATLADTARMLGCSPSHLSRMIRRRTGRSFTDILQVLRLDEASNLLCHTDCTVDEAMAMVGYTGKANFYSLFRQRFGTTPAVYRSAVQRGNGAEEDADI